MSNEIELLEVALIVFLLLLGILAVCLVVRCVYTRKNKSKFLSHLLKTNDSVSSGSIKGFTAAHFRSSTFSTNSRFFNPNQRQSNSSLKSVKIDKVDPDPLSLTSPESNRGSKSPFVLEVIRECEEKLQEMDFEVNLNPHGSKNSTEQLVNDKEID